MRVTHPNGTHDIVMVAGTRFMAEVECKDAGLPGWVSIGYIGDGSGGLLVDSDQWLAFMALVKEIDEARQ